MPPGCCHITRMDPLQAHLECRLNILLYLQQPPPLLQPTTHTYRHYVWTRSSWADTFTLGDCWHIFFNLSVSLLSSPFTSFASQYPFYLSAC